MKKIILSLSALLIGAALYAQEGKENAVVNVENDYNPVLVNVKKKKTAPKEEKQSRTAPIELKFSDQGNPFDGFTSERRVRDLLPKQEGTYNGYARLGAGTGNWVDLKAAYKFKIDKDSELKALASLDGYNTGVDGLFEDYDWRSRIFRTLLDAEYTRRFGSFTLNMTGSLNREVFNYQDLVGFPGTTNKQGITGLKAGADIASNLAGSFSYKAHAGMVYNHRAYSAGLDKGIGEMGMNLGGTIGFELPGEVFRNITADIDANFYFYSSRMNDATSKYHNVSYFDINPYADMVYNDWKIKAGLKMNFRTKGAPAVAIAPNVTIEGMLADKIGLYAEIKGGRTHNGFEAMNAITPYWNYDASYSQQLEPTYKVVDMLLSARFQHFEPVTLEAYTGFVYTKDDLMQVVGNMYNDIIYVELAQQDTRNFFFGAKAKYDDRGWLSLSGDLRFNSWNCKYDDLLIMKPRITMDLGAEARPAKGLTIKVGYNFTHYTSGETVGRLKNKNDLYARASYQINDRFGAFVQGNNLLNNSYYDYAGYETRGIRGMIGATMNF